jgi:hypothetical protein
MRVVLIVTALALGLAACQQSKSEATEAPAPKKLLSRSAPLYAGQEQILEVDNAKIEPSKDGDSLLMTATGKTATGGYYDLEFLPRINPAPPADGIYGVDIIGYKPQSAAPQGVTTVETKGEWKPYPKDHLKGVRFVSKTNNIVAMLPAPKADSAQKGSKNAGG